jgi:hypothetical protein
MSAPVEPFVIITSEQVIAAAVALGVGAAGIVAGVMKWSFSRNVKSIDDAIAGLRADFKAMNDKQHSMEVLAMQKSECTVCRKECQDRLTEYQRLAVENDRIQNQKLDNLLMMMANVHNGMGGVKNGLKPMGGGSGNG